MALLALTAPIAGCIEGDEATTIQTPSPVPHALVLTYEVTDNGTTTTERFISLRSAGNRTDIAPYELSRPDLRSPFLRLDGDLNPGAFNWSSVVTYPLEEGRSWSGTVGGADATITARSLGTIDGGWGTSKAVELTAEDQEGTTVGTFIVLDEPRLFAEIDVDTPDGTEERWTLSGVEEKRGWNAPPRWEQGHWWSYDAMTRGIEGNATLIYTRNGTAQAGSPTYLLSPQQIEHGTLALPFQQLRMRDLASQSGLMVNMLSKVWEWPLQPGKTWTGLTSERGSSVTYQAHVDFVPRLPLPDGNVTAGFAIDAFTENGTQVASWTYAPVVEFFTRMKIDSAQSNRTRLNWTLTDWGTGFHGEFDEPHRTLLFNQTFVTGPTSIEGNFTASEKVSQLQLQGIVTEGSDVEPNVTVELRAPDGSVEYARNSSHFRGGQIDLNAVLDVQAGNWTVTLEAEEGAGFFLRIQGLWVETKQVDFR